MSKLFVGQVRASIYNLFSLTSPIGKIIAGSMSVESTSMATRVSLDILATVLMFWMTCSGVRAARVRWESKRIARRDESNIIG